MKTSTRNTSIIISTAAFALTAASMMDFIDGYSLASEFQGNTLLIFRGKETFEIKLNKLEEETAGKLFAFFNWINPNDVESVIEDWNHHCEVEESIMESGDGVEDEPSDDDFTPGTREHAIFEKSLED